MKLSLFSKAIAGVVQVGMSHFRSYVFKAFIMLVLVCSIASAEFPELARLSDNASNDFTTPTSVVEEVTTAVAPKVTATVAAPALRVTSYQEPSKASRRTPVSRSSRDVLVLYSILRT
jgi:hypothetical protein